MGDCVDKTCWDYCSQYLAVYTFNDLSHRWLVASFVLVLRAIVTLLNISCAIPIMVPVHLCMYVCVWNLPFYDLTQHTQ